MGGMGGGMGGGGGMFNVQGVGGSPSKAKRNVNDGEVSWKR